jgi:hypothetical protein
MLSLFSHLIVFKEYHEFDKITGLSFRDNFESVRFVFDADKDWSQILPKKIKNVIIEIYKKKCIIQCLPQNIVSLIIDIDNTGRNSTKLIVPPRVEYLSIEGDVEIIGSIPNTVTTLEVLPSYLRDHIVPNTVKTLRLAYFHEKTKILIPKSIVELVLTDCNDKTFDCSNIPDHIIVVRFEGVFNVPLVGIPPKNLRNLYFGKNFCKTFLNCVTETIEFISFGPYRIPPDQMIYIPPDQMNIDHLITGPYRIHPDQKVFEQTKQINIDGFDKEICPTSKINSSAPYFVRFYKTNLGDGME